MRGLCSLGLAAALLLAAPAATAQVALTPAASAPATADPDAVLVEELVVTAREKGPAFWRVSTADGGSSVYVLGVPSIAPKHMAWDQARFMRLLQGAHQIILPAKGMKVSVGTAATAAIMYLRLKSGSPFEETLPSPDRERFIAARTSLGQPAKHYGTRNPLAAALILGNDYRDRWSLTESDPSKLIRLLATQAKVPVQSKTYDLGPLLGMLRKVPYAGGQVCLDEVLQEVAAGPTATLAATRAWAEGDVRGALAQERTYERCVAAAPGAAAFDTMVKQDQAAQIAAALKTPGRALAVVPLRPLLAQGGVLDRLRAQGFVVRTPGDAD